MEIDFSNVYSLVSTIAYKILHTVASLYSPVPCLAGHVPVTLLFHILEQIKLFPVSGISYVVFSLLRRFIHFHIYISSSSFKFKLKCHFCRESGSGPPISFTPPLFSTLATGLFPSKHFWNDFINFAFNQSSSFMECPWGQNFWLFYSSLCLFITSLLYVGIKVYSLSKWMNSHTLMINFLLWGQKIKVWT